MTGSCFLLETEENKILIDCGLLQCRRTCEKENYEPFPFDPKEIKAVFSTHSHIDHIGRIPKLVKDGFKGKIYSTFPTKDLSRLMLEDSYHLMQWEIRKEKTKPLFDKEDLEKTFALWEGVEYSEPLSIGNIKIKFLEAGHILGSAMVEIEHNGKKAVFTGDFGNMPTTLLRSPAKVKDANFLVMDSLYGDREHEGEEERKLKLERVIEDTINKKGVLMIPSFSLERTQVILYELNSLIEQGRVPQAPVFIDSPLAIKVLEIYKKYDRYFNEKVKSAMAIDNIFNFPGLKLTISKEESMRINDVPPPKIIIAGSGMSEGGRIIFHEERYLSDPNSTLLINSYQAAGSLGRHLQDGVKNVYVNGRPVTVKARIEVITGYSAHGDRNELFNFVERTKDNLETVFLIHSESKAALFLAQRIRDYLGRKAVIPKYGEIFEV